ncbi:MAG: hypothetical protein NT075_05425 [Chloroflexi bacterium]|nr:hypothetical protein [Chloroflexota bacterium]
MTEGQLAISQTGTIPPMKIIETAAPQAGRDGQLQASRRIDWRFLLPDPRLGRVAYRGPAKGSLVSALQQFSTTLTLFPLAGPNVAGPSGQPGFERVVLHSPNVADLDRAAAVLMPGGYLYWEIDRTKKLVGLHHFRHYVSALARRGFTDIHVHWHRPNFEGCLELIPLDQPSALNYVFARVAGTRSGQLQMAVGRILLKTTLLARLVPCFSLVACKGPASAGDL